MFEIENIELRNEIKILCVELRRLREKKCSIGFTTLNLIIISGSRVD